MILTLSVRVCWHVRLYVSVYMKCGNEGIYLCTLLNYNCITVFFYIKKNTLKETFMSKGLHGPSQDFI